MLRIRSLKRVAKDPHRFSYNMIAAEISFKIASTVVYPLCHVRSSCCHPPGNVSLRRLGLASGGGDGVGRFKGKEEFLRSFYLILLPPSNTDGIVDCIGTAWVGNSTNGS
jgi:hypothetical protein